MFNYVEIVLYGPFESENDAIYDAQRSHPNGREGTDFFTTFRNNGWYWDGYPGASDLATILGSALQRQKRALEQQQKVDSHFSKEDQNPTDTLIEEVEGTYDMITNYFKNFNKGK